MSLQGHFWVLQLTAVFMFVGLCFIEGVLTKRNISDKPPPELVTDAVYWFVSPYLRMLSKALIAAVLVLAALALGARDAPAFVHGFGPLSRQPAPLLLIETLLVSDLCSYWAHRAQHRFPVLWRVHAIHHSPKVVRWSTVGRVHPLNELLNYAAGLLPCLAVGLPVSAVLSIIPVMMWWAVLAHSNIRTDYGPLRHVFVSPVFHRFHHTHSHDGGNKNFANVFSLWDRLFGSFHLPAGRQPEVFGLDEDDMPESYVGQLLYPFGVTGAPVPQRQVSARR
jgi:sterol desaturase/sphingolipid hydroxylase (fatty acid hydroxylase superfamily)